MHEVGLITMLAVGLSAALILGYITQRLGLSPIVGYLLAGIVIGPYTPGFVGDTRLAGQLAEIGVILLMFGVGLHFHLRDLMAVQKIAIPGAIGQIAISGALATLVAVLWNWHWSQGLILGTAVAVASTVVLTRVLTDNDILETARGRIAIGWLIVEDIITVLVLVLLPMVPATPTAAESGFEIVVQLGIALGKLALLGAVVFLAGQRAIPWVLTRVARTRSRELFTLTVLVFAIAIAAGSATFFGASFALGAFLAGMVVGQSRLGHQAAADALPMRDTFAIVFFVSVGMLFDPIFLVNNPGLILAVLAIILIAKPLVAFLLVLTLGYSIRAALTVAIGLAQIGEFSFILGTAALKLGIFPEAGLSALVACALISISLNPLLFKHVGRIENWLRHHAGLWRTLNRRVDAKADQINRRTQTRMEADEGKQRAIVVGYGPVGQTVSRILLDFDIHPVIVDLNIDTIEALSGRGIASVYGDAARPEVLRAAGIAKARFLIITIPDLMSRIPIIATARELNDETTVLVRARYLAERVILEDLGATAVCFEEAEAAVGLSEFLLRSVGVEDKLIRSETNKIRSEFALKVR